MTGQSSIGRLRARLEELAARHRPGGEPGLLLVARADAVLGFDTWDVEHAGGSRHSLDANVGAWLEAGRSAHPTVDRVLDQLRQPVARLGDMPEWFPASLLESLKGPGMATPTDALPHVSPSGSARADAALGSHSEPKLSQEQPPTQNPEGFT